MKAKLGLILLGLFLLSSICTAQPFSLVTSNITGVHNSDVSWGDFDNDGDLDLLLGGSYTLKLYRNNLTGFSLYQNFSISLNYCAVSWIDYDNDGDLDFMVAGKNGSSGSNYLTQLYKNNGNGVFTQVNLPYMPSANYASISWGDFNNDGLPDLLLNGCLTGNKTQVFRNCGNDSFYKESLIILPSGNRGDAQWMDFDKDGYCDIIISSSSYSGLYKNQGNGTFSAYTTFPIYCEDANFKCWDFNQDGLTDVFICNHGNILPYLKSMIFQNNGTSSFSMTADSFPIVYSGEVDVGDFDNDGDPDILINGSPDQTSYPSYSLIYQRLTNGSYSIVNTSLDGTMEGTANFIDYDLDNDLDVFTTGFKAGDFAYLYKNLLIYPKNNPPGPPSHIFVSQNGSDAVLKWNKGSDNRTLTNGLSYNIRVGTSRAGIDIVSPMSDLNTGFRKVMDMGNAYQDTFRILKDLPNGIYYWSVQSIDNSYTGSIFSYTDSFRIPCIAPKILTHPINDIVCQGGIATFSVTDSGFCYYQWQKNKINITGANSKTLVIDKTKLADSGLYRCIVFNSAGTDTSHEARLVVLKPHVNFAIDSTLSCMNNNNILLHNLSTDTIDVKFVWDFGDNTKDSTINAKHIYSLAGKYSITLTATDSFGCFSSLKQEMFIKPVPKASFICSDTALCLEGNAFLFTNQSSYYSSVEWDLGDNNKSFSDTVTHHYLSSGLFSVKLIVRNQYNCADSAVKLVNIYPQPEVLFSMNNPNQCLNENHFIFTNKSTISNGKIDSFMWSFGDSTVKTGINTIHTYSLDGIFKVMLMAVSDKGCMDFYYNYAVVYPSPKANFTVSDEDQCFENHYFQFTNKTTLKSGTVSYFWNFGDGGQCHCISPSQLYAEPGAYNVSMIATSSYGCADTFKKTVYVRPMPDVRFKVNDEQQCLRNNYFVFTNQSSHPGSELYYLWSFADGDTSTLKNPEHVYSTHGEFNVFLKGVSNYGCADSASLLVIVVATPPKPEITKKGDSLISSATIGNQWYNENGPIAGATGRIYIPDSNGHYFVTTTQNGCSSDSSDIFHYVSMQKTQQLLMSIFPNPSRGFVKIYSGMPGLLINYELIDLTGKVVKSGYFSGMSQMLRLEDLSPGSYILKMQSKYGTRFFKVIREQ